LNPLTRMMIWSRSRPAGEVLSFLPKKERTQRKHGPEAPLESDREKLAEAVP